MKKNIILYLALILISQLAYSQEICDNGIDDDGDGLVDMNDAVDCFCTGGSTTVPSLIPNPSFENMACCPSSFSQMSCAQGWIQASGATSDYMNTCDMVFNAATSAGLVPFPDGNGCVGTISSPTWQEYVGSCLPSPMLAGTPYTIQMSVASTPIDGYGEVCNGGVINYSGIDLVIYGAPNCSMLPFSGYDCPPAPWYVLGTTYYTPVSAWQTVSISFTPAANVGAIIIGSPCTLPGDYTYGPCYPYFYYDNLILNQSSSFGLPIDQSGGFCTNDLVLTVTVPGAGTVQWYYQGVAIVGQTGTTLNVAANGYSAGDYQAVYTNTSGDCAMADITVDPAVNPVITLSNDTTICGGGAATISAGGGPNFTWDNGLGTGSSHSVSPTSTTTYNVTVTDNNNCTDTGSITVTVASTPVANAGTGGSFCSDTYTFTAVASVGTGTWTYTGPGTATFTNVNSPNSSVTVNQWGTYTFTWTENNGGCTDSDNVTVTFNYTPTSTFTALPSSICISETSTITYTGTGSAAAVYNWNWDGGTANPGTGQGPHTVSWNNSGTYDITLSVTESGCTSTITTVTVTVNPTPTSTFSVNQPDCYDDDAILTYTGNATGSATFSWNFNGGTAVPGGGIGPQYVSWNAAGTVNVTLSVTENGCTSGVTTMSVTTPTQLLSSVVGTNISCHGDSDGSVDLTASGGTAPLAYTWSYNGYTGEDLTNVPAGLYSVTVTDANNCTKASSTVITEPSAIVVIASPDKFICNGQTVNISASASGGTGSYTYSWDGVPGNAVLNVGPSVQTTYTVSVVDGNGCPSNTDQVIIYVTPSVELDLYTNTDHVCPGDEVVIVAGISGGIPPYYLYDQYGMVVMPPFIVYPMDTTEYIIYVKDQCNSFDSDNLIIYTYPLPPVSISSDTVSGCQPLAVNFSSLYTAASYVWNFGETDYDNLSFEKDPQHIYDDAGTYTVSLTVTSAEGCINTVSVVNMITVYPVPMARFLNDPDAASIIKPTVYFYNLSSGHVESYWNFGDGAESNLENPYHTYPIYPTGTYNVMLVVETDMGCLDTAYKDVIINNEFTFYAPSAFSPDFDGINDYFFVYGNGLDKRNFNIIIFDRWGEPVFETDDITEGWDGRIKGGEMGKNGVYTWLVTYKDLNGIEHEETGAVSIIR